MRLLLIDDSCEIRNSIRKTLLPISDIEIVGEAAEVQKSIELIHSLDPHIVILDFQLSDGNALEVLADKLIYKHNPIIIILSSYVNSQYGKACLDAGADYYFNKSKDLNEFFSLIIKLSSSN